MNPLTTPITIMAGQLIPTTTPTPAQYTAVKKTVIKWIEVINTDTSPRIISFYNGTAASANLMFSVTLDAAGGSGCEMTRACSSIVEIGGTITALADVGAKVRCAVFGATYEMV